MNWKQHLFKPKWQHKSADIRLESVTTEQHPELIQSLMDIAAGDEDVRVRCAAIKRLHQLENILKLYDKETHAEAKELLEDRIRQLAASTDESRPPLKFRMQVVERTANRDLIEHLAGHAPETELRHAALAKVQRQGVLGDCCIEDRDAENRRFAASRITQHTTIKRVLDALRKRDKALYTQLQQRLHQELLEQGDSKAVQAEALHICSGLEKTALQAGRKPKPETDSLHTAWQQIAGNVSTDMSERYQRICERLAAPAVPRPPPKAEVTTAIEKQPAPAKEPEPETREAPNANEALAQAATDIRLYEAENPENPKATQLGRLKNRLEKVWAQCTPPHPQDQLNFDTAHSSLKCLEEKLAQQHEQIEAELGQARELLKQLQTELEQGSLHKALETRAKLQDFTKKNSKTKQWKPIASEMAGMQARLRELREWQHWSNNKVRKRLIAEMEVLPAADLHPDALLDRIKTLQVEWKTLEESEQIPGEKRFLAAPWMWRKFSAAGHTAFDTAKPYLDKRSEIQSRHAQSLSTFCAELKQLAQTEPVDMTALAKGLNRGRKKLHDLNNVPARQRQKIARQLKAALDKANEVMQAHYQEVERDKMKLIRAASQLIHMPERSEAIEQAKSLQSNWKAAGSLWRSKEQELWNQFREHLDPLFGELKEQQASIRAADDARLATQKALCAELREIVTSEADLSSMQGKVQGLQDSWKDIQHPDRRLLTSFQNTVTEYEQKIALVQQQQVEAERERWWLKSSLLHELTVSGRTAKGALSKKSETRVKKDWPQDSSDDELEMKMDRDCVAILAGNTAGPTENDIDRMTADARLLCIRLEFIAGLSSPDDDRELRMKYQVDRLAESMSGTSPRIPAVEEAHEAEKTWLGMYVLSEADFKTYGKRIRQALNTIIMES